MGGFEVRELIIKATIVPDGMGSKDGASANISSQDNDTSANEEIIRTCVEKIMEILKEKNGR